VEPIFFRRSGRTASVLPEAIGKGGNLVVSECGDAMSNRCRPRMLMRILGVFVGLSRMLMPRQVILFSVLLGHTVGMSALIVYFGGSLVVLVMRSLHDASSATTIPFARSGPIS
jgi:hypothetical protein